jgi:hypothetical protein
VQLNEVVGVQNRHDGQDGGDRDRENEHQNDDSHPPSSIQG